MKPATETRTAAKAGAQGPARRRRTTRPVLGLTMGDPSGIGPELCLQALRQAAGIGCVPVVFGDAGVLERLCPGWMQKTDCRVLSLADWENGSKVAGPIVVDCKAVDARALKPGRVSASAGRAGYSYICHAIRAALEGRIEGVVTAPIHKEALRKAGVPHPGHTEIFTILTGARRSCMMLHSEALTVSMATTHIGYAEVPGRLSVERVLDVIELTAQAVTRMLRRPARLAICGLNPHAGEHGLFGRREEERLIEPAVARARKQGIELQGPLPPDAAFTPAQRKRYDAIVTLYHDQGHIPFKMLAFETGVNLTLGLPIVRTSVDHGTAFDIAWKGVASPESLFAAIRVAAKLCGDSSKE
jgi:4-hydroxythreonine-4-phosphate dehydrogenase